MPVTVLLFAVMGGYSPKADMLKVLIDAGADVNVKYEGSMTLLHVAALYGGDKSVTELLIAKGANVNTKTLWDETPLDLAMSKEHKELVDLLRKHGGHSGKKKGNFKVI
ncbi:MAG: ankyrin repeat domain-containing protein [Candidatus Aminicenantales bacterium]